jgi:hypothetical protein
MENRDGSFWSKVISAGLRDMVMPEINVTGGVSKAFVESGLPLADCGDFVWSLVCLSRWIPEAAFEGYSSERAPVDAQVREALLASAINATDFYDCPMGGLVRLLARLKRNVDSCAASSPEEAAHKLALERIEDIVLFTAERHPAAEGWVHGYQRPKLASVGDALRARPTRRMRTVAPHLRLV